MLQTIAIRHSIYLLLLFFALSGCVRYRDLVNFRESELPLQQIELIAQQADLKIQPNDLLQITVSAGDSEAGKLAAAPFNPPQTGQQQGGVGFAMQQQLQFGGGGQAAYGPEISFGYLVDTEGKINIPTLGTVGVGGLTLLQIHQRVTEMLGAYLENPSVDVRLLNFKVTLLGEVLRPGILRLSNQRTTILEAISASGDLTPFANRRSVVVVREMEGQRSYYRLDLTRADIFASPAFYLRQNDMIYIEPLPVKVAATPDLISRIISYAGAGLSLVTLILALTP